MGHHQLQQEAQELSTNLQDIQRNFAYRMLVLQIRLYGQSKINQDKIVSTTEAITELTQLYMRAVEVLEDKYCQGFQFFNSKIQNLLKKRSVIQQLLKQTKCSVKDRQKTMKAIEKAQIKDRRQEYNLRLSLQNPSLSKQRVQQIIKNSQLRLNMIESRIQTGIHIQDAQLAQRIKARKLRSESSTKDPKDLMDSFFQFRGKIDNSEQINKYDIVGLNSKFQKTAKSNLKKKANPHLFSSFSVTKM